MNKMSDTDKNAKPYLQTLPGDDVRQIMWRYADRYDLAMLVQSTRSVARGIVARLVANGARNTHEWTPEKEAMLKAFDDAGITAAFMEPEEGGFIAGPKNLALALIAFELSWVDAGAATASLAGNLGLSPIHERGTEQQRRYYMSKAVPKPGENEKPWRYAFALTEPIPFVGVDTGVLSGKVRIAEWKEGEEPILQVDKRGRFITNMAYANVVTAAVDSDDPRIKGSCMIILEETDPGIFDRGTPTKKLVHQLSSTADPVFSLRVPASRIIGGYTIKDGVIVPNYNHSEIIEAVFKRTRVTVALMSSAKLLSAIEPIIRYQRNRFRGGEKASANSPRYELGLQQKEDALYRLIDIWASGEAGASLGFEAARVFDNLDPIERQKDAIFAERKISGPRAQFKALSEKQKEAIEFIHLETLPERSRDNARYQTLKNDTLVQYIVLDALANVLCPACKLWNTGHGATMMREAVSLMGGYGITEDCPGFLLHKWVDAQLEATYEGPEAVQRLQLSITMTNEVFLAMYKSWISQMRHIGSLKPGTGACALATAMEMWLWTLNHLLNSKDANGNKLYSKNRQGVTFPMADALCWLLATRQFILDVLELEEKGASNPSLAEGLPGLINFYTDLCHVQTARAAGEVGKTCAQLVFGYNRHPVWDDPDRKPCYRSDELESLEGIIPGIASGAQGITDIEKNNSRPEKAGPCVCINGYEDFARLRVKMDGCLTGAMLAKDRAAEALTKVMIPEALDYPA
ncbi:MAG: acyl-CoA dehydrogenase family protein [Verrucomicrobiia bacterium]